MICSTKVHIAPKKCLVCLQHLSLHCHRNTKVEKFESHTLEKRKYSKLLSSPNLSRLTWHGGASNATLFYGKVADRSRFRFADVTHEVKPVLSGRRLVLTYNLVHTTLGSKELEADSNRTLSKLRLLLSGWNEGTERDPKLPKTLAYLFENQYTNASLCYDGLKGHDHQVAAHLREACNHNDFCFYLTNLTRTLEGGCDEDDFLYGGCGDSDYHEITEKVKRQIILDRIVELDGTEVAKDLEFDEDLFMQEEPFENEERDDEDYSGFTGNEGVSATHFYNRTVRFFQCINAIC